MSDIKSLEKLTYEHTNRQTLDNRLSEKLVQTFPFRTLKIYFYIPWYDHTVVVHIHTLTDNSPRSLESGTEKYIQVQNILFYTLFQLENKRTH